MVHRLDEERKIREGERGRGGEGESHHYYEGNYEQTGGKVTLSDRSVNAIPPVLVSSILFTFSCFSAVPTYFLMSLLQVNGSITLTKVTVTGIMIYNTTKLVLFRSLTKSILKGTCRLSFPFPPGSLLQSCSIFFFLVTSVTNISHRWHWFWRWRRR